MVMKNWCTSPFAVGEFSIHLIRMLCPKWTILVCTQSQCLVQHLPLLLPMEVFSIAEKSAWNRGVQFWVRILLLLRLWGGSHLPYEEGVFLPESTKFDIPGTSLNIDSNLRDYLLTKVTMLKKNDLPHLEEHSEVELTNYHLHLVFPRGPQYCLVLYRVRIPRLLRLPQDYLKK